MFLKLTLSCKSDQKNNRLSQDAQTHSNGGPLTTKERNELKEKMFIIYQNMIGER